MKPSNPRPTVRRTKVREIDTPKERLRHGLDTEQCAKNSVVEKKANNNPSRG